MGHLSNCLSHLVQNMPNMELHRYFLCPYK